MSEGSAIGLPPAGQVKSLQAVVISQSADPTFELLLTLVHPSKHVRTPNRKMKTAKVESENRGPFEISVKVGWVAFLGIVAEKLAVQPSNLVITSLEWHWLKPSSGPWLPVQDENGLASMLKQIKSKPEPYVIVRMQAPTQKRAGNSWDNDDEVESGYEDNPVSKKVCNQCHLTHFVLNLLQARLDDKLKEIVAKLTDKYPPGLCSLHPDIPCFHHRVSDLHFKLERTRLLVWAQAIKSGKASYEKVPILSPTFKDSAALKRPSKNAIMPNTSTAAVAAASSSIHTLAPTTPTMPFANLSQYGQYPQMLFLPVSPFMGYGAPGMVYPSGNSVFAPGMVSMPTRPSPPSSPPAVDCTIAEFCQTYKLGDRIEVGLEKLGFCFGDDLNCVSEDAFMKAGFKLLEWNRLLKAYSKLKRDTSK